MGLRRHADVFLLLGAPGAGKGTQARFVAQALSLSPVATCCANIVSVEHRSGVQRRQ